MRNRGYFTDKSIEGVPEDMAIQHMPYIKTPSIYFVRTSYVVHYTLRAMHRVANNGPFNKLLINCKILLKHQCN